MTKENKAYNSVLNDLVKLLEEMKEYDWENRMKLKTINETYINHLVQYNGINGNPDSNWITFSTEERTKDIQIVMNEGKNSEEIIIYARKYQSARKGLITDIRAKLVIDRD